ncbi:MAG: winged helix-turn-helix domain-containing protein [Pyrinomonadaceae bacterium]
MEMPASQIFEFGEFRLDTGIRQLSRQGEPIALTPKVFDTLLYLVRNAGKVIGKDELMSQIWTDSIVEENNLNQNISILRRVFGEKPGEQRFIVTVAGHGYRFVPEVTSVLNTDIENVSANLTEDTNTPFPADEKTNDTRPKSRLPNQGRLVPIAAILIIVLSVAGFYLWKGISRSAEAAIKTVAVLPFKPLVVENRNEELELGMADALISKLTAGNDIVVRPLSSIRRFNSVEQDAVTAGRELGVESVLDGTIQNWGDRVRISAKLIRISDGKQLWGGQFDEKFTDIFAVQDSISEKVASALKIRIGGKRRPTENVEAYQLYMKGLYNITKGSPADLIASIPFFEDAIKVDPGYALAYTGLANAFGVLGLAGDKTIPDVVSRSRAAEQRALELDDTLGQAQIAHCMGLFWYDWDWAAAEKACVKAIEIDPNNSDFHGHYAMVLSNTGRHTEAVAESKRSCELNPINLMQSALEGQYLLHAGRVDEALERLKKTSDLEPNFWMTHMIAAGAYIEKGMFDEAIAEARKEYELTGANVYPVAAYALAKSGKPDEARAELNKLLESSSANNASAYNVAMLYNSLDDTRNAISWLERAYTDHDPKMTLLKVDPKWNNLRSEPAFIELITKMNLN